jgi:predicted dehydrogenase
MSANTLTRRRFLQGLASAAAVVPLVQRGAAAQVRKVRHASIGASGMALSDIRSFSQYPAFELVAVADVDLSKVERVRQMFPGVRVYQDWRELLRKEEDAIDSLNVSTPDHMHAAIAMSAMRAGKHVYLQKPLAATLRETRRLTDYARKHRLVTQMGIQISSHPTQRTAEALIRAGAIGKVVEVHTFCNKHWGAEGLLPAAANPVPPTLDWNGWLGVAAQRPYQEGVYHPSEWRRRVGLGTGTLGDMGCHILSTPYRALDLRAPLRVTSHGPAPNRDNWAMRSKVHYVFAGNERTSGPTVDVWWYDGDERPPAAVADRVGDTMPATGCIFVGTGGLLVLPHISAPVLLPAETFQGYEMPPVEERNHYAEFLDAVLAVRGAATSAGFSYAGPLTEVVLLGTVASWYPGAALEFDARKLKIRNKKDAGTYVRRQYRNGWKVRGL